MGSDLSRPRTRRNVSVDSILRNRMYPRNVVTNDYPVDYNDYRRGSNYSRPYIRSYQPQQHSPPPPQVDPNMQYMNRNSNIEACIEACRTSRPCSPVLPQCPPANQVCYNEIPIESKNCRQSRYRTVRSGNCLRDDDYYVEKPDPRQYTISRTHQPIYDDCLKPSRLPAECDYIPSERVYEIRKEKVMIKTDRNSLSPPRYRSKSTDRYIEMPKSVRILNNDSFKREKLNMYENSADNLRSNLKSRSGYMTSSDDNQNYHRFDTSNHTSRINLNESGQKTTLNANQSLNKSQNCLTNDIIYVPMVREEFIKRETQKLKSDSDQPIMNKTETGLLNFNNEFRKHNPNKIIIREVSPLNNLLNKTETCLKSILKNNASENFDFNGNGTYNFKPILAANFNNNNNNENIRPLNSYLIDQSKVSINNRNGLEHYERHSTTPPTPNFASNSTSNLKYSVDKDGILFNIA